MKLRKRTDMGESWGLLSGVCVRMEFQKLDARQKTKLERM